MKLEVFISFDGNCREAVEFYSKLFRTKPGNIMTYGESPPNEEDPISEVDSKRIIYAGLPVGDMVLMCSDIPSGNEFTVGNNICLTINSNDEKEIGRLFNDLKQGGEVYMELSETFFSKLYGMVADKFGVIWQIMYYPLN
ncbi:MAG: VOC family protein [Oscillospiraceae bacterium]|nr:VOC family protein [Oscillospiraceae bacterium]